MSVMSERHYDTRDAAAPVPRWTLGEYHAVLTTAALGAWQSSNLPRCYGEVYALLDAGIRAALPEHAPLPPHDVGEK